jgi:hypothetical protein
MINKTTSDSELISEDEVLTREVGIRNNVLPTGRKLGVVPDRQHGLFWIRWIDGKQGGIPDEIASAWTSPARAQEAIQNYVTRFWNISDNSTKKKQPSAVSG